MPTKKKRKKRKNPSPPRDPNPGSRIHASLAARTGTATAADAMFLARFFSSFGAASVRDTLPTNAMRRDATLGNPRFPEPKNYPGTRVMNRRFVMGIVTSGKITTPFRASSADVIRRRRAPNEP